MKKSGRLSVVWADITVVGTEGLVVSASISECSSDAALKGVFLNLDM